MAQPERAWKTVQDVLMARGVKPLPETTESVTDVTETMKRPLWVSYLLMKQLLISK